MTAETKEFGAFVDSVVDTFHRSLPGMWTDHILLLRAALDQARTYGRIEGVSDVEEALADWPGRLKETTP